MEEKIKGDHRDGSKYRHPPDIPLYIVGMGKSLGDKKAHDGQGESSHQMHGNPKRSHKLHKAPGSVIHHHCNDRYILKLCFCQTSHFSLLWKLPHYRLSPSLADRLLTSSSSIFSTALLSSSKIALASLGYLNFKSSPIHSSAVSTSTSSMA